MNDMALFHLYTGHVCFVFRIGIRFAHVQQ